MQLYSGKETVLAIGDLHCPFEHKDALDFLTTIKEEYSPTKVVCMGDEIDAYALSSYIHDPDGMSSGQENDLAIKKLKDYYKLFPEVMVCTSNHTVRPFKRAFESGIPKRFLKSYGESLEAPVTWQWKDHWMIDEVVYEHGEGLSGEAAARNGAKGNMRSTVIGHVHSFAGISYLSTPEKLLFGFNVGCLIDVDSYAFTYGKHFKAKPIIGAGIIHKGVPTFIPMVLDKKRRWVGKL